LGHQPPAVWPDVSGPKVFGYLQAMPSIEALLRCLREAGVCALLLVRGLPLELKLKYSSERLRFLDGLVDLASVAAQADGVIHHANHSSLIVFTEAGLPQLLIPRQQEQLLLALRLAAHGGAVLAYQDQPGFDQETQQLLTDPKLRAQARALAQSCQRPDPAQNTAFMQNTLRALLA
jgi:UDP-N-acetylglucosamine:LPS N-acetylglucosamine transferase